MGTQSTWGPRTESNAAQYVRQLAVPAVRKGLALRQVRPARPHRNDPQGRRHARDARLHRPLRSAGEPARGDHLVEDGAHCRDRRTGGDTHSVDPATFARARSVRNCLYYCSAFTHTIAPVILLTSADPSEY